MKKYNRTLSLLIGLVILSGCTTTRTSESLLIHQKTEVTTSGSASQPQATSDEIKATGYAAISSQPHANPTQQRLLAIKASKLDAYRALTEQVYGVYVDASTSIGDLVMQSDSFRSRVRGVIYGATLESIQPLDNDTYEVILSLPEVEVRTLRQLYLKEMSFGRR